MEVTIEEAEDLISWDHNLSSFTYSIFLSTTWLTAIAAESHTLIFLVFKEEKQVIAMLSGLSVPYKSGKKQLFFFSAPAFNLNTYKKAPACLDALYDYARIKGYVRIIMKSYDFHAPEVHFPLRYKIKERKEYVFQLTDEAEKLIGTFDPEIRRLARKAQKNDVLIKEYSSVEWVDELFRLLDETYKIRQEKGYGDYSYLFLPYLDKEKIKNLVIAKNAFFLVAEYQREPVSIQLLVHHNHAAYGLLMGNSVTAYKTGAPSLLFREGLKILHSRGFRYYNIGGVQQSKSHEGLRRFKDKLNASILVSSELETNFIGFPYNFFNPLLMLRRNLENGSKLPWRLRKEIIRWINNKLG
jgi:lipid II:glycine glycyltransferase (peptidoglycan interpeptide bridge formation enzyme)